jgi:hypothetical protein
MRDRGSRIALRFMRATNYHRQNKRGGREAAP